MDTTELTEKCLEWQELLGMKHWRIEVHLVRGVEIRGNCGQNDYSLEDETSLIRIKDACDYHGYYPYDMEAVLVHELLHLLLDTSCSPDGYGYEQMLSRLSRLLVKLRREKDNMPE